VGSGRPAGARPQPVGAAAGLRLQTGRQRGPGSPKVDGDLAANANEIVSLPALRNKNVLARARSETLQMPAITAHLSQLPA
ncbi:MAG TPA: hypothetical protein VN883_11495, partial [Myxococcales bacterium]|nr:hypothetical protein [Myxococcales bacterium]